MTCPVGEAIRNTNLLGRRAARCAWDHPAKPRRVPGPASTSSAGRRSFAGVVSTATQKIPYGADLRSLLAPDPAPERRVSRSPVPTGLHVEQASRRPW